MHVCHRRLTCVLVHVCVLSLFTLQQHASVSSHCLQTLRSSCTPADPRAYQRVSWSPIATSSLASREWPSGYPTCGRQHKTDMWSHMVHSWKCDTVCVRDILMLFSMCTVRLYKCSIFPTASGQICKLVFLFFDQIVSECYYIFGSFRLFHLGKVPVCAAYVTKQATPEYSPFIC